MEQFFLVTAMVLVTAILVLILKQKEQGIGQLLSIFVCTLVMMLAVRAIQPLIVYIHSVQSVVALDPELLKTLLKCVGISITAEIAELICQDSGNSALGKALQLLATAIISCLCIPMLTRLLELIQEVISFA
jgi:stage III sporulation protein AD